MHQQRLPRITLFLIISMLLIAFAMRVVLLDRLALWFDEGVSITFATVPVREVMDYHILFDDVNPPAYRVLLGFWMRPLGVSDFTARYLSVVCGLLAVPLTYRIGRALQLGLGSSVIGATLVAFAPMQVYYSQEAKGYTFVQLCVLVVVWLWLLWVASGDASERKLPDGVVRWVLTWLSVFVPATMAFGSHYISGLMFITINVLTLVWMLQRRSKAVLIRGAVWLSAQICAALVWIPWVLNTADRAAAGTRSAVAAEGFQAQGPVVYLQTMTDSFVLGPLWRSGLAYTLVVVVVVVAIGIARIWRQPSSWLLGSWFIGVLWLGFAAQMAVPFFFPRFLLYVTPALWLIVGAALAEEFRPRRGVLRVPISGIFVVAFAVANWQQYHRPGVLPDLRPLVSQGLRQPLQQGDALLYSYSWQPGAVTAYLPPGSTRPEYIPNFFDANAFDQQMSDVLREHSRTWLLTYEIGAENPINDVGQWLLANTATPGSQWYGESQLTLFLADSEVANSGEPSICYAFDGERIEVCFAELKVWYDGDNQPEPREPIAVHLYWQANEPVEENYIIFMHVLRRDGSDNPVPIEQSDGIPVNGLRPTYTWQIGEEILDRRAVNLTMISRTWYDVVIGLYDADTGERLPVDGGSDSIYIGSVMINGR